MLIKSNSIPVIVQHIESLQPAQGDVVMLLVADEGMPDIPVLIEALNEKGIPFFGGVFPGLLYGKHRIGTGCIIRKFKCSMPPFCVTGIGSTQLSGLPDKDATAHIDKGTAIVLLDGLSPNISLFLEKLNNLLGEQCHFMGGGAGYVSFTQHPCVFTKDGFEEDAAVVCVLDKQITLGVRHGWEQLSDPLVATQIEVNTIIQLNWEPAINVYNKIVEADCGIKLNKENFAEIAQAYPFGVFREKEDDIVRHPLGIGEDGSISCIGDVPPNTVLHVLKGSRETLLKAARKAITDCGGAKGFPIQAECTFVVDCITRAIVLEEEFSDELNIIREGLEIKSEEQEPFGVLSLGEISSYGDGLLELFNKTVVIGTIYS
ncbi:MAG: FIST signal transduction protein [Saprospiraceae bacterium]